MGDAEDVLLRCPHQKGSHTERILAGIYAEVFQFPQVMTRHIVGGKILQFREVDHVFLDFRLSPVRQCLRVACTGTLVASSKRGSVSAPLLIRTALNLVKKNYPAGSLRK